MKPPYKFTIQRNDSLDLEIVIAQQQNLVIAMQYNRKKYPSNTCKENDKLVRAKPGPEKHQILSQHNHNLNLTQLQPELG